ncbi:hypothetical protein PHET_04889 [Paragonimus heterotremus]|uniref:BTB domain-containing protein n=1 Tax=Paragonimus heterotremus TaxID=100268 RepID=A0A8J4SYT5_9TREM|nr:hypothetical protein PHET_04889 [Paragonimus heterotremus]
MAGALYEFSRYFRVRVMSGSTSFVNPERKSSVSTKPEVFEFDGTDLPGVESLIAGDYGEPDVIFLVGRNVYPGHQPLFGGFSQELKNVFEKIHDKSSSKLPKSDNILTLSVCPNKPLEIHVDAPADAFEAVFNFCYSRRLSVSLNLVPSVFILAKRLRITALQQPCADYLTDHISMGNIGELCHLVQFGSLMCHLNGNETYSEVDAQFEFRLVVAVYRYIKENADGVACSLTGQLGARLIVNLTGDLSRVSQPIATHLAGTACSLPNESVVFAILCWAHDRFLAGQRLARAGSEENVQSDDEESDGGGGGSGSDAYSLKAKRPGDPFGFFDRLDTSSGSSGSARDRSGRQTNGCSRRKKPQELDEMKREPRDGPKCQLATQDVRITLDIDELPSISDSKSSTITYCETEQSQSDDTGPCPPCVVFAYPPHAGPESETCLLAPTTLGVGTTSIWLGKLAGHLVSLSVKSCRSASAASTPNHLLNGLNNAMFSFGWNQQFASSSGRPSCVESVKSLSRGESLSGLSSGSDDSRPTSAGQLRWNDFDDTTEEKEKDDDEVARTVTAESASYLAKAAAVGVYPVRTIGETVCGIHAAFPNSDTDRYIHSLNCSRMLEARSGAGVGLLRVTEQEYLVLVGGYTRKGCLDSVELYSNQTESAHHHRACLTSVPERGPRLTKPRGRLAVAHTSHTDANVLYACGGSTGSVDLNSVERLTSDALAIWLSSQIAQQQQQETARTSVRSRSSTHTSPFVWQSVAKMHQARSSPVAVGLSELSTGPLVSNPEGALMVAGGLTGATALASVEAFVPDRNQWVMMPNMYEDRYEAACGLLPAKNLIVVVGGNAVTSRRDNSGVLVEALDPRCSAWMPLPSPIPGGHGRLRGAALVTAPTSEGGLLLVGGFNGQETLSSTWIFDPNGWQWIQGPSLLVARANSCAMYWSSRSAVTIFGGFNTLASASGFLDSIELISFD